MAAVLRMSSYSSSSKPHNDLYVQIPSWKDRISPSPNKSLSSSSKIDGRSTATKRPSCDNDGERKVKRRRSSWSLQSGGDQQLSPGSRSFNGCGGRSGNAAVGPTCSAGGGASPRLTERQQLALIMQMTAEQDQHSVGHQQYNTSASRHQGAHVPVGSPSGSGRSSSRRVAAVCRRNDRGETPLHRAARRGDVKQTKKLICEGADVNCRDNAGWTALHESCNHGRVSVARQLLKAGADANAQGYDNSTPLHDAASNGNILLVELLLRHGANPLSKNTEGQSSIDVASTPEVVRLLRSEIIASSSSDDDDSSTYDVRSPTSPESCDDVEMALGRAPPSTAGGCEATKPQLQQQQQAQQQPMLQHRHHPGFHDDATGLFSLTPPPEVNGSSHSVVPHGAGCRSIAVGQVSPPPPIFPSDADTQRRRADSPPTDTRPNPRLMTSQSTPVVTSSTSSSTAAASGIYKKVTVSHHMDRSSASLGPRLTFKFQHIKKRDSSGSSINNTIIKRHHSGADLQQRKPPTTTNHVISPTPPHRHQREVDDVTLAIASSVTASPLSDVEDGGPSTVRLTPSGRTAATRQFEDISDAEDDSTSNSMPGQATDGGGGAATKTVDESKTFSFGLNGGSLKGGSTVGDEQDENDVIELSQDDDDGDDDDSCTVGGLMSQTSAVAATSGLQWTDPLYPTYTDPMSYSPYSTPLLPATVSPLAASILPPWQQNATPAALTSLPDALASTGAAVEAVESNPADTNVDRSSDDVISGRPSTPREITAPTGNESSRADADVSLSSPPPPPPTGNDPATPSTPKIPRLKIVMSSASDGLNPAASPLGSDSCSSLPYVVTVDGEGSSYAPRVVSALPPSVAVAATAPSSCAAAEEAPALMVVESGLHVGTKHRRKMKHCTPVKPERDAEIVVKEPSLVDAMSRVDDVTGDVGEQQTSERRVTRSAMRQQHNRDRQQQQQPHGSATDNARSEASGDHGDCSGASRSASDTAVDDDHVTNHVTQRGRGKHGKAQHHHQQLQQQQQQQQRGVANSDIVEMLAAPVGQTHRKLTNPYAQYSAMKRKFIECQGEVLSRPAVDSLPRRLDDFLMVRRDYTLHAEAAASNTTSSAVDSQQVTPAKLECLSVRLREVYVEQEEQRQQLSRQHQQERVRLHLLAEQEMLRAHERASRLASTVKTRPPISACALLDASGVIYNTPPADASTPTKPSLEDQMDDIERKFYKLKDDMLVRQRHEAEVLHSTQRLQWNWFARPSLSSVLSKSNMAAAADSPDIFIRPVAVDDQFNLFPQ